MGVRDSATRTYGINYIHLKVPLVRYTANNKMPIRTRYVSSRSSGTVPSPE